MKKPKTYVGIDVSKKTLDVSILDEVTPKTKNHFVVPNNQSGFEKLTARIKKHSKNQEDLIVCFEHTGMYSMPLSVAMQEFGIRYAMVPALEIYRSRGIKRGKSDKADSYTIAEYALTHYHKLTLTKVPEKLLLKLKTLISQRDMIVKTIGNFQRRREIKRFMPEDVIAEAHEINEQIIADMRRRRRELDKKIEKLVLSDPDMKKKYELARSIPGVGPQTSIYLLVCTRGFTSFENWRKLACYAGVAPFEYSSGTSIRGGTKVSQLANKKIKSILNMAALTAIKYDPQIHHFYARKINEGKNPMSVMNAIRCKLLSRIFATVKRGTPYVVFDNFGTA